MPQTRTSDRIAEKLPMPAGNFDLALRLLGTTAQATAALLEGTDVTIGQLAGPEAEITLGQGLRLLRNANRIFPPGWALHLARAFQPSAHGPLGIAAISASTLREALDVIEHACHLRHPAYRAKVHASPGELRLEITEQLALYEEERLPLIETFLLSFQGIVEAIIGRPMSEGRFEISSAKPAHVELYRDHFNGEVRFEAPESAMVIPAKWGELRCPFANPGLHQVAMKQLEASSGRYARLNFTAAHVEHMLMTSGDAGLSMIDVATRLGLSERTLVRRLGNVGTTFRDLRDAQRRRRAEELLRAGNMTIAEVGYQLGYLDAANFNRACRRWFGRSPGSIRQKRAGTI